MDRFWAKVDATGPCWEWTAAKMSTGYGAFRVDGRTVLAHRFSWEMLVGIVPKGLVLDHLCRNRACVNPDHLEVVTNAENLRRGAPTGGGHSQRAKTRCKAGHPLDSANTYRYANGWRKCRACAARRMRKAGA